MRATVAFYETPKTSTTDIQILLPAGVVQIRKQELANGKATKFFAGFDPVPSLDLLDDKVINAVMATHKYFVSARRSVKKYTGWTKGDVVNGDTALDLTLDELISGYGIELTDEIQETLTKASIVTSGPTLAEIESANKAAYAQAVADAAQRRQEQFDSNPDFGIF